MLREPGVGVVTKYDVGVLLSVGVACAAKAEEAEEASVALVRLKPSGYSKTVITLVSLKVGIIGFELTSSIETEPVTNDETSFTLKRSVLLLYRESKASTRQGRYESGTRTCKNCILSIHRPSKGILSCQFIISCFHQSSAPVPFKPEPTKSGKTV